MHSKTGHLSSARDSAARSGSATRRHRRKIPRCRFAEPCRATAIPGDQPQDSPGAFSFTLRRDAEFRPAAWHAQPHCAPFRLARVPGRSLFPRAARHSLLQMRPAGARASAPTPPVSPPRAPGSGGGGAAAQRASPGSAAWTCALCSAWRGPRGGGTWLAAGANWLCRLPDAALIGQVLPAYARGSAALSEGADSTPSGRRRWWLPDCSGGTFFGCRAEPSAGVRVGFYFTAGAGVCFVVLFLHEIKMPIRPDLQQLEKCIDDALRKNDFKPLKTLLQIDICEDVKIRCTKQFFHKLDDLICRELNKKDIQTISVILVSIGRCGKNINILGQPGLLTMIKQGLVQKMIVWFEKSKEIILSQGNSKDEAVINVIEDLFDLFMVIHDVSDEGKRQIVDSFIPRICALVIDSRVNISFQQEILKKMNAMLDKMPQDARKILSNQEMLTLMSSMGEKILDAGDYDLQVGIVEALCRMTTEKQRQQLASQWFSMDFIANAFKEIKDCEFETDCRIFLNLVNGMLGDKRRVFTFPCLSAFLDKHELQIPSDENLEDFWIDFNLGSQTVSFYIAGDDDHQWEAVTVPDEKVQMYSVEVRQSKKLLTIILKNTVKIGKREGKELLLYFDASLEITSVVEKIFGASKYREFSRKQGVSVAKTSVHILFDASGSQILVPESQFSNVEEELTNLKEKSNTQKEFANPSKSINNQRDRKNCQPEITTPSKRKMSEASMIVPGADRYTVRSPVLLVNTSTPRRRKIKPPLQMMSPAEKADIYKTSENAVSNNVSCKPRPLEEKNRRANTGKHIKTAKVIEKTQNKDIEFQNQNLSKLQDFSSDIQGEGETDKPVFSHVLDNDCENKLHSKWACWTPVSTIKLCNNQIANTSSGDTFNQDICINKNHTKQQSSSSISDHDSEETGKGKYKKEIVEHSKIDKPEVGEGNSLQQNHPKCSVRTENTEQSDWHIESETTFKSVLLNKTIEESLIYRKKYVLSKDVNAAISNKSPSRKNMRSHRKSEKEMTSEPDSSGSKQKMREKSKGRMFTDAAESLINQINKRYKPKDDTKPTRTLKESVIDSGFSNKSDQEHSKIQEFQATARETCMDNPVKLADLRNHDKLESSFETKDKRITTNRKKQNIFSDTDTEYKCDDSKTDISWLREPKSKPQLADYSRNKNVKKHKSRRSRPSLDKGPSRSKMAPNQNIIKKVDETIPDGRTRLPRRATKIKKNYKDLSNSESESEQESSHSFKEKFVEKEENIHSRNKNMKLPKKQQKIILAETQKELPKNQKTPSLLKDPIRDNNLDLSPISLAGSPSSIEIMRCVDKITENDSTQDYDCITKSLSPYPKTLSPGSLNSNNRVGSPVNSPKNNGINILCASVSCSPIPPALLLPSHTPRKNKTGANKLNINSVIFTQETQNCNSCSDISSYSSEKQFMETESPHISENHIKSKREESHSLSPLSMSSEGREKMCFGMTHGTTQISGLTQRLSCKRMYIEDTMSNSNEVEMEEMRSIHLLPKRFCKAKDVDHHTHKMFESLSPLSTNDCFIPENWKNHLPGVGMICEKLNSQFKRKIHVRRKMTDYFTKQSWKTVKQHVKTMNHQIQEYRIKRLDKFQMNIMEELENFEKDSQSLEDLEKEFVDFWEKIYQQFREYQRSEEQRLHLLKTSLCKNVFYKTDYEETVFTSEVGSMKENLKMLQERLLMEMQEEELLNVHRGLMSLFMAHDRNDE
ncbi:synaptonemal complex protein 2 isoform X3 [Cavia porcellus]|uniref:synaptonemal complex protein 2 isoform X3 n=1 Tax=Cavia porcellus TaxID=10141 RepID=UPI002FE1100C